MHLASLQESLLQILETNPQKMPSHFIKHLCFSLIFLIFTTTPSFCITTSNKNFILFGDAHFKNTSISLTQELTCLPPYSSSKSSSSGVGRAFYQYPIRFLDFSTNTIASFSCKFSFSIAPSSPYCSFGDGVVFLITSNPDSVSLFDGYMGLPESDSQDSYLAIEFDTHYNKNLGDINGNHVSVDLNSVLSVASVDSLSKGIDLKGGRKMTAWIEYNDSEKTIRVWVGYSEFLKPLSPLLVCRIDISKSFREFMHVGFSASNGKGSAIHSVDKWRFSTSGFVSSTMLVDTFTEELEECLICIPGDSSSTATSNGGSDHLHRRKRVLGLVLGLCGSVLIVLFVIGFLCLRKRKKAFARKCSEGQVSRVQANKVPKRLSLTEVRSATKGFNRKRIIGEGASAVVYEGLIPSCGPVAIKRFSEAKRSGNLYNRFTNEFGTMVGCLRHKNLVQLLGWCCERNELVLVYEYMPNGSLDRILHSRARATKLLTWERRLYVVLGIASALVYLHDECEKQIIHRDLKTCNIMLDAEFNAKLGDFGLAEVYEHNSCKARDATLPAGTMGYLAPEYVYSGIPSVKTDVYSFGVVAMEVATGRRPVNDDGTVLTDWVWDLWGKGILMAGVDPTLMGRFNRVEIERMFLVGLSCVHPNYEKRPTMREAARMLKGEAPLPKLPAKKPAVKIRATSESSEDMIQFTDKLDVTPWSTPRTHLSKH